MFVLLCHCQESPNVGHLHRWLDQAEGQIEIDVQQRCASRVWRIILKSTCKHEGLPKSGVLFVDWNRAFFGSFRFHLLFDWPNGKLSNKIHRYNHSTSQFWSWLLVAVARCSTFVVGRVLQFQCFRARETHHILVPDLLLSTSFALLHFFRSYFSGHVFSFQHIPATGFMWFLVSSPLKLSQVGVPWGSVYKRYIYIYVIWLFHWIIAYV